MLYLHDYVHCISLYNVRYTGDLCEHTLCELSPCSNNSLCDWSTGICNCSEGYTDQFCDVYICDRSDCLNGATCVEATGECICTEGMPYINIHSLY